MTTKKASSPVSYMECETCSAVAIKRNAVQRYCPPCSVAAGRTRQKRWAEGNPRKRDPAAEKVTRDARRDVRIAQGMAQSEPASFGYVEPPVLLWSCRVVVPFDYGYSKNAIWRNNSHGHVFLRKEASALRRLLAEKMADAMRSHHVANNRLWIDVMVEKPDHRGDAVNVLDTVCDAIQDACGLDDRWYSIRFVDWRVVKVEPRLMVGVGQESAEDVQVCSYCGRCLPYAMFGRNRSTKSGLSRTCQVCSRLPRRR